MLPLKFISPHVQMIMLISTPTQIHRRLPSLYSPAASARLFRPYQNIAKLKNGCARGGGGCGCVGGGNHTGVALWVDFAA